MLNTDGYTAGPPAEVAPAAEDDAAGRTAPAVVTEGLSRAFGELTAVDGLDLRVGRGEIYGFLGPNGAGKSTAVRMLCTLLRPTSGQALVAGRDVAAEPEEVRTRIGVALQEAALDDRQTGRELLRLQGRLHGLSGRALRARVDGVLDMVDLGAAVDRQIGTYSGGMKRRIDLGAALLHGPEVLFLDEPTTGLDPSSRAAVWAEVERLRADLGITIFLTTQYLEEADALADRVGILSRGRLVAEGRPQELKRRYAREAILVELAGDPQAARRALDGIPGVEEVIAAPGRVTVTTPHAGSVLGPVVLGLERCPVQLRSVAIERPSLDDVFGRLTGPADPARR